MISLHYLFDPLSGASHGATSLIRAACVTPAIKLVLHAGIGRDTSQPQWREAAVIEDRRIARLSRQAFGEIYFEILQEQNGVVPDSVPVTTAILAAEETSGRGLAFLAGLQHGFFGKGLRVWEPSVLRELAQELLLDVAGFEVACEQWAGEPTNQHLAQTSAWLARTGGKSLPMVVLERADGMLVPINLNAWYGRPADFAAALERVVLSTGNVAQTIPPVSA